MENFTPQENSPREENLKFIRAFARLYSPTENNEDEARALARTMSQPLLRGC